MISYLSPLLPEVSMGRLRLEGEAGWYCGVVIAASSRRS